MLSGVLLNVVFLIVTAPSIGPNWGGGQNLKVTYLCNRRWLLRNWDKSAAIFCHQVAARVPRYVLQLFNFVKNRKIINNSANNEAREKLSTD
jgi:hypothetical protein